MKAKLTKLFTLLTILTLGITNVWGVDYSPLNYNGGSDLPSGYKYYGSSAGTENKSAFSITTYEGHTVFDVTAGGSGAYNKRAIEFTVSEDCTLDIEFYVGGDGRILNLFHGNSTVVHSSTGTTKGDNKYTFSYSFEDITSDQTYSLSGSGSKVYISKITFAPAVACTETAPTSVSVSGGATYDKGDALSNLSAVVTGGTGTMSYQWYRNTTNVATVNNDLKLANCTTATLAPSNKVGTYYYYCVASNCAGSVTSGTTAVTINPVCPPSGTIYKFQVKTGLTNGNLVTSVPKDVDMTTDNYLSALVGGELMAAARANVNRINITGGNAIGFSNGADAYLEMTLDCAIQAGDIIKYTIASNNMLVRLTSASTEENQLTLDRTKTQVEVPAAFVGATKLYMIRASSSPNISYFEVFRPAYNTITLEYADGVTPDGSLEVIDGEAATKPADPTWEHHRFDGWYNGATPYDWTSNVTGDLTLTAHWTQLYTVTYAAGDGTATGDAPTQADKAEGETFTVAANTFAVAGKDFLIWNDGSADYAPGATYTVETANVVLTAVWKAEADKYTVIFKDGETELGTKLFEVSTNPSDADIDKTKALNTFAAWQKEGVDIALDDAFWATVAKDATVTLTARWTKAYASSVDLEGLVEASGTSADWQTYLTNHGYAFSTSNVSLDEKKDPSENKPYDNWPYQGLKAKVSGAYVEGNIEAGKLVIIKLGHMAADATVTIDGVAQDNASGLDAAEPAGAMNYYYLASEGLLRYETTNAGACVLKAITITDPYTVSFAAHGDADPADMQGTPSVDLPTPTNGSASFLGWFDAETGGNKIGEAGETYTPTANITLHAQWEAVSTDTRISALTYALGAAAPVDIYEADKNTFNIALPYAQAYDAITVAATPNHASASIKAGAELTVSSIPGTATFTIVAQSGAEENYTVNFTKGPKDGVCIIKGNVGDNTFVIDEAASLFEGTADKNNVRSSSADYDGKTGWKFNSRPARLGLTLSGDETFQEGDVVEVFVTSVANISGANDKMRIFDANDATSTHVLIESPEDMVQGANRFVLPATTTKSLYLHRSNGGDYDNFNPFVAYIAVYRPMNPMLTAITINGETGTINEGAKTVAVELQPGYDLAALTIVPTIVSNTAEADVVKTVTSNGGEWIIGANTYRLTDKDGDYTEYTVTLSVGEVKHTVSFNTHGGSAVASVEVVEGEKLAAAPADPTKEDYLFQGWSEAADGSIVDVTSFTITADKVFHAIWASDGAIKLLDGATVNHTNFITGVTADETVEFMGNTVNYAKFSGTVSGVNGVKDLTRVIAYNATTNKTKIRIYAHNNSTSGRNILVKGLVEGADAATDLATIALGNKEDKISDWIEFNNAANRTIYIFVPSSAGDVYFTQVKVIESGETPMKQAGEAGYSLNFNKGRFFGLASTDLAFEGLNARLSGDYTALNSGYAKLTSTSMSFTVASDMALSVTTNNNKTYYVTEGAAGTDNETAKTGVSEFNLTAGTWYITAGASEVQFTNIAFSQPTCPEAVLPSFVGAYCEGGSIPTLDATATNDLTDYNVVYSWFAADAPETELANVATFTPTADGDYKVKVTVSKAGYLDAIVTSDAITVAVTPAIAITMDDLSAHASDAVALTVNVTAGVPTAYAWYTCDDELGTNPVLIAAAEAASYNIPTPVVEQYYKVVVSGVCGGDVTAVAHVTLLPDYTRVDVTESTTWDWTKASEENTVNMPEVNVETLLANVPGIHNDANFNSQALLVTGQYAKRDGGSNIAFQGTTVRFYVTKPGKVTITARRASGTGSMDVSLNGTVVLDDLTSTKKTSKAIFVPAGWVTIEESDNNNQMRLYEIVFNATPDYKRDASTGDDWMAPGELGTVCIPNGAVATGGDLYTLEGRDSNGKIVFATVPGNVMTPGVPYLFQATSNAMNFFYTDETPATEPDNSGAMKSTFEDGVVLSGDDLINVYYFNGHALWNAAALTELPVVKYRAYVKMDEVSEIGGGASGAPGRRYIIMDVHGQNATTGFGEVHGDDVQCTKVLINGQLFILRGEKMYDTTGRLVK